MKRINILMMLLLITALSSCGENGFNNNSISDSSFESSSLPSESYSELLPSYNEDGWDDARVNYVNPNPSLKEMSENVTHIDFSNASGAEKDKIVGLLENYAMLNNLTGIPLIENGEYVKFSDRVVVPTAHYEDENSFKKHKYIMEYGFGVISEGYLDGALNDDCPYPSYYQSCNSYDYQTANVYNDNSLEYENYLSNLFSSYFSTKLNESHDGYVWFPSLASKENIVDGEYRPLPLDNKNNVVENANENTLSNKYRIYVRTGENIKYNTLSTNPNFSIFAGRNVEIEDYLTPYKEIYNKSNNLVNAKRFFTGKYEISGLNDYYQSTENGYNEEKWNNVGIKTGNDEKGDYLDFTFVNQHIPYDIMYYVSMAALCPIPSAFVNAIGGVNNYGSFVNDELTPVDTSLSLGTYMVEKWIKDEEIVFKRNEMINSDIKGGGHRYEIPGIYTSINNSTNDLNEKFELWEQGLIDDCIIPLEKLEEHINTKGTQMVNGALTTTLNINTCNLEMWEKLFGENGTIIQTKKEDYWDVKPAMSNDNFIKGMILSIDRVDFSMKQGGIPSVSYFGQGYKTDYRNNTPYSSTSYHKQNLLNYYGSEEIVHNYGFDLDEARKHFALSVNELLESGEYKEGDTIEIEVCWPSQEQEKKSGSLIEQYLEDAFNDSSVCNNKLTLDVVNTNIDVWFTNIYYNKMINGQFDIACGSILGGALNVFAELETLKSDNSSGFTLKWGVDTNSTNQLITYNEKQYTYDALLEAVKQGTYIDENGKNAMLFDATILSNFINEDGSRTISINYCFAKENGDQLIEIEDVFVYNNKYDKIEIISNIKTKNDSEGVITISIDEEVVKENTGIFEVGLKYTDKKGNNYYLYLKTENNNK